MKQYREFLTENKKFNNFHEWKKASGVTYDGRTLATINWPEMKRHVPQGYTHAAVDDKGKVHGAWSDDDNEGYVE